MARNRRNRYEERNASKVGVQQNNMNNELGEDQEKLFCTKGEREREIETSRAVSYTHLDVYKRQM